MGAQHPAIGLSLKRLAAPPPVLLFREILLFVANEGLTWQVGERSKRHHYVAQHILRGFAKQGQIRTVDLKGECFSQSVGKAAAENNYNTVVLEDGELSDAAERAIAQQVEGPAHHLLTRISEGGWIDTDEERVSIARYLALQSLRVPGRRREWDELADQTLKLEIARTGPRGVQEAVSKGEGRTVSDEEALELWDAVRDFDDYRVGADPQEHVITTLEMVDEIVPMLLVGYHWGVLRFEQPALLTCDSPLLLLPARDQPPWMGTGLANAAAIAFPVSRRTGLLLGRRLPDTKTLDVEFKPTSILAGELNRLCAWSARRFIYHHPDDRLVDLVGAGFELPEPRTAEIDFGDSNELLTRLASMAEWHFVHDGQPHPMSGQSPHSGVEPWTPDWKRDPVDGLQTE